MQRVRHTRLPAGGAVAMTALALVGQAAAADGVGAVDDRPTHGPGAIALEQLADVARPDDRANTGPGGVLAEQPRTAPSYTVTRASTGFDWADAGVGALGMLGLVFVVAGGSVVAARRRLDPVYPTARKGSA